MKGISLALFLFLGVISIKSQAQEGTHDTVRSVLSEYNNLVRTGRLMEAAKSLSHLLESNLPLTAKEKLGLNNNLGILHKNLGQYDIALKYYDSAESISLNNDFSDNSFLISIYGNKANIYLIKGEYNKALEYTEKGIRFVKNSNATEITKQQSYSSFFLNAGIVYAQMDDFNHAVSSFKRSLSIKEQHNFTGKANVYLNIAKVYVRMRNIPLANKYFQLSIEQSETENTSIPTLKVNILLEFGYFLTSIGKNETALKYLKDALQINLENSGEKNQLTANCYQLMGDNYNNSKKFSQALTYYQKALISGSLDFNDQNFQANPTIDAVLPNLWQLRVLRRKAEVLVDLAGEENDSAGKINDLGLSLCTINLAIEMINSLRLDYQDEETRLDFNEKQKNIFVFSIETALKQYELTGEKKYINLAYNTSQQYKANELKYEIARNKSLSNNQIPDLLINKEKELKKTISGYNIQIRNENSQIHPDTTKITYWKDQIFDLKRALDKTIETIENSNPKFTDRVKKGYITGIETIQENLNPKESLIEYVMSDQNEKGARKIFEFVITKKTLICHTELIDSTLSNQFVDLKIRLVNQFNEEGTIDNYNQLNTMLFNAYATLIQPIKKYFSGDGLIIIPDGEISFFPFEAFLTSYANKKRINYAELPFLINDYSISYSYSTNTLWNNRINPKIRPMVIGFAPDYTETISADGKKYNLLRSNTNEIKKILTIFHGDLFEGKQASATNFRENIKSGSILHLAMHAELDSLQTGSSNLLFTPENQTSDNYRLYNYEIGQMKINSPMVVLSACNTGNGKLYSGEGAMSIARNFVLAGVPSVIETLWPVEDIAGSKIMVDFYKYLAEGKSKNAALRLAKLDYIQNTSPSFVNPRFWAAYTLIGDETPIKYIWWKDITVIIISLIITMMISLLIFYRLRFFRITIALFL